MKWVQTEDDLKNFLSLVVLYAPDEFPEEDYLEDNEQLNLERAFSELNHGLKLFESSINDNDFKNKLKGLLNQAHSEYKSGNSVKGAHLVQEFEALILNGK